jgi:O-antigen ligase
MHRRTVIAFFALLQVLPWLGLTGYGPGPAALGSVWAWGLLGLLVLCFVVVGLRGAPPALDASFALALVLAALLCTGMGLLQYFGHASAFGPWISPGQLGEAYANLRQRNQFATLTNLGLVALLWWQACGQREAPHTVWSRSRYALCLLLAALLAVGTAASNSRTGLLQLLLVVFCSLAWQRKALPWTRSSAGHTLLVAVCAYGIAAWTLPVLLGAQPGASGIVARLQDASITCQSRSVLWANVWHLVLQKPWLGWGWGELDYAHFITLYPGPRFCDILDNAHNLPLQLAVELGLPCAALACGAMVWWVLRNAPWKETQPGRQLAWAVLGLVGVHSLLEYPLWYGPFQMATATALLLLLWHVPRSSGASAWRMRALGGGSALVLALCVFAAADYWRMTQLYVPAAQRAPAYREDTLQKLQGTWLFGDYVRFAELTTTPLQPANAAHLNTLALQVLHFSPEPKVVRLLIDSAVLLGQDAQAAYYQTRFDAAFANPSQ